jgi:ATP-dependent RNA helicase DDX5/DBP2
LAPTRELATQIEDEARKFGGPLGVKSVCCYGGAPKGPQMASLRQGAHVCIATPGRLNDFLEAGMVDLYACRYLVFDEADRMLDMGFEPQIRRIVARCPDQRQTLFFTATWPREVRSLASEFLSEPVVICVEINQCSAMSPSSDEEPTSPRHRAGVAWRGGRRGDSARTRRKILIFTQVVIYVGDTSGSLKANSDVTQHVYVTRSPQDKDRLLAECVRKEVEAAQGQTCRIIVFANSKRLCDQLERSMPRLLQLRCSAMHGDKDQYQRTQTIEAFKVGICPVLIATDVAARGLDIKDVRAVINYDFPGNVEDYVHRIGRTGRAGATGNAYTFFTARDDRKAGPLVKLMEDAGQDVPDELRAMVRGGGHMGSSMQFSSGGGRRGQGGGGNGHYGDGGGSNGHYGDSGGNGHYGGGGGGGRGRGVDNRPAWMSETQGVAPPRMPSGPPPPGAYADRSRSRSRGRRRRDRSRSRDRGRRRRSDSR